MHVGNYFVFAWMVPARHAFGLDVIEAQVFVVAKESSFVAKEDMLIVLGCFND